MRKFKFLVSEIKIIVYYDDIFEYYFSEQVLNFDKYYEYDDRGIDTFTIYIMQGENNKFALKTKDIIYFYFSYKPDFDTLEKVIKTAIGSFIIKYNRAIIHGGFVNINNNGVIYSGPSNIGKTTFSKRFSENCYNDENIIVCHENNKIYFYNTPWVGREKLFSPIYRKVEIRSIVFLEKMDYLCKEKLFQKDSLKKLINSTLAFETEKDVLKYFNFYNSILKNMICYKLGWSLSNSNDELKNILLDNK